MDDLLFQSPPNICRGTDFWMLNDRLDDAELIRQLHAMHSQGVASLIARTYIGLKSDYPGPDWMHKMHVVVDEARSLGMTLFMQAGYMPEAVMGLPVEYSLGDLRAFPTGQGVGEVLDTYNGVDYCLTPSIRILDMLNPEAIDFYIKQSYEDMWKEFKDEFGKTIISMWVDEPSFRRVALPWTEKLPAKYSQLWGEPFPMNQIHALFVDCDGAEEIRLRFWRTVQQLMKAAYFQGVRDWCHANNLLFSGHLMAEDTMESQIAATCFTMPFYKYFDIPGIDYLTAHMNWQHGRILPEKPDYNNNWLFAEQLTPLQCTSAAHQAGKSIILAEMYGVSTENLNLRDQKQMFDSFAVMGINHRSVHGYFYSLRGRGKRAYPPHIHDYQPYFPRYKLLTDALARESWFLRQGKPQRDVLLIHPMESAFEEYHAGGTANPKLKRRDRALLETIYALTATQCNFELGDEDTLVDMAHVSSEAKLIVGEMSYKTVVLPDMRTIRESTLEVLEAFTAAGGCVLALGNLPYQIDGKMDVEGRITHVAIRHTPDLLSLSKALIELGQAFTYRPFGDGTQVRVFYKEESDSKLFFLFNNDASQARSGEIVVDGSYSAQEYHPDDGQIIPIGVNIISEQTCVPVNLEPGGSQLIRLVKSAPPQQPVPSKRSIHFPLTGEWSCKRLDPNALVLEMYRFARNDDALSAKVYPILTIQEILTKEEYRGELTLQCEIESRVALNGLKLSLESPLNQSIQLDGISIPNTPTGFFVDRSFETIPLPDIAAGMHTITIQRYFEPLAKPTMAVTALFENLSGVELEPAYLVGNFAVRSLVEAPIGDSNCIRLHPHLILDVEPAATHGELSTVGYPFYVGRFALTWEGTLSDSDVNYSAFLELEGLNACVADVLVNGKPCGNLTWLPFRVPLRDALISGVNRIELTIYGTLRNMLGPWHRPVGEIGACWGGYAYPNLPWLGAVEYGKVVEDWFEDRYPDREGWTERYLVLPFGVINPKVIYE
ncbi:hypothetical protein AGMMS49992_12620 [Clostridia bacterium]|nr:hypothetical protein AGMMS49992_12620 [Clostridia bacterium]